MKKLLYGILFLVICAIYLGVKNPSLSINSLSKQPVASASAAAAVDRSETILIVGVQHAPGQFRSEKFSPAHVRATLDAFDPQVVGVESNPEWFAGGQFYRSTYEAQHVAVPFALKNKLPLYGIDWIGEKNYTQRDHTPKVREIRKILESPAGGGGGGGGTARFQYGLSSWQYQFPVQDDPELDFYALNGVETGEKDLKWIDAGKNKTGSPEEYMEERDNHIVDYITAVADRHPGARIAIVIGSRHKSDLERKLRARGFRIVGPQQVAQSIPAAGGGGGGEKMDDLLTAQDIAAILAEAWDSTPRSGVKRARAERLLKRLLELTSTDPRAPGWGEYFTARHKMLGGDLAGARADFERISKREKSPNFPFGGYRWRQYLTIRQAALLELGRIADIQNRREEAVSHYKRLLSSIKVPDYSEDYHNDYLFYATAYAAIRALTESPYSAISESKQVDADSQTAASGGGGANRSPEELKKALELSRSGNWHEAAALTEEFLKNGKWSPEERCQGYVIAASAYARDKKAADARRHLQSFDAECTNLPADSWMVQRRKQIGGLLN